MHKMRRNGWNWKYTVQLRPTEADIVKWIPVEETIRPEDISINNLLHSSSKEDSNLALIILENSEDFHFDRYTDQMTRDLLEISSPYYEYIGIRAHLPNQGYRKDDSDSFLDISAWGQPWDEKAKDERGGLYRRYPDKDWWSSCAIWELCDKVGVKSGCGNSHQRQINTQLSTGLYHFKDNRWYKRIIWNTESLKGISSWLR